MQLTKFGIDGITCVRGTPAGASDVTSITADSRTVTPGALFFAIPGVKDDGQRYVADAMAKGAVAVVIPEGAAIPDAPQGVAVFMARSVRKALSQAAALFYPLQPASIVAVTGTDGKTSVAHFTRQLCALSGRKACAVGTIGITGADGVADTRFAMRHTTPDPVELHRALHTLAAEGVTHAAMEASSHGLDQCRLDGVRLAAAGFTNLTRDHLDYHGTMEAYFDAKARLFDAVLPETGMAVINADDAWGAKLIGRVKARGIANCISYGAAGRQITLKSVTPNPSGLAVAWEVFGRPFHTTLALAGYFQAHNVACAAGLALAGGLGVDEIMALLPKLTSVRGRLEKVAETAFGASIFVDYAHTPHALATALKALRGHTAGRLVVVFGCGGDRDRGKRPEMARVAGELADRVIVTDDNPRSEVAAAIRAEVLAGFPAATEIGDRREAIERAIAGLQTGDVLLIAGKGHETYQIIGSQTLPFDDAAVAREAVGQPGARKEPAYG